LEESAVQKTGKSAKVVVARLRGSGTRRKHSKENMNGSALRQTRAELMPLHQAEAAPSELNVERRINWKFDDRAGMAPWPARGWQRLTIHAALFVTAGSSIMMIPSIVHHWPRPSDKEILVVGGSVPLADQPSAEDLPNSPVSAVKHQLVAERERQKSEVLIHQLATAREDLGTLRAQVTALTDERTAAEKAMQTAQASVAEQKQALEQERQRGEAMHHELESAREDIEARKETANSAEAAAKNALVSASEQRRAAEKEHQRAENLASELSSARADLQTLTARVTALTDAEKALQTARAAAAEQKQALEQRAPQGDTLLSELASARESKGVKTSETNTHAPSVVRVVATQGSNIDSGTSNPIASPQALPLSARQKRESHRTPAAVSGARSRNELAQAPEMAPPALRRFGQGAPGANGWSPRGLSRQENRPARTIGQEYRAIPRQNYSSIRLFDD